MPVCGNRARHAERIPVRHSTVEAVRRCHLEPEAWPCEWLNEFVDPEDGERRERPCHGVSWHLPGGRGYRCEHGHSHIYDEVRVREGWDYVSDDGEAALLAVHGVRSVAMNGGPLDLGPATALCGASPAA
ncbi:hypothetical protein AB0A63_31235 [Lentzea sp. NPDC042327]|uniref:hypothetical protein n=1 Tax=Lentzea sp. NPDC042327 TaxID=3154801 RepID=UPI0033DBAD67